MAYYCHQCNRRVTVSGDLECDTCHSEFVEEIDANDQFFDTSSGGGGGSNAVHADDDEDGEAEMGGGGRGAGGGSGRVIIMQRDGDDGGPAMVYEGMNPFMGMLASPESPFSQMFSQIINQRIGSRAGDTPTSSAAGAARAGGNSRTGTSAGGAPRPSSSNYGGSESLMNFFNQLMTNLADNASEHGGEGGGGGVGGTTPTRLTFHIGGGEGGGFFQTLHGNLNDYAWGEGGVDAIVTQLLNQFESGGQNETVSAEDMERLPMTTVSQKQVDNGTQCATCMETFTIDEKVARLDCQHIFHHPCIVPWLKKHNTCPICRKVVNPRTWPTGEGAGTSSSSPKITDVDELD